MVGICGGYQMLGTRVCDPERIESSMVEIDGLGLLPITTIFSGGKETHRIKGRVAHGEGLLAKARGAEIIGYEIHMGRTTSLDGSPPAGGEAPFLIEERSGEAAAETSPANGSMDPTGRVMGTYIHGLFHNTQLRRGMLQYLADSKGVSLPPPGSDPAMDQEFDKLADWVRSSLNMDLVYAMTGISRHRDVSGPDPAFS